MGLLTPFQIEFFGAFCFLIIALLIISILIAVWVYRDAESRGMNGVLWLIVVVLLGLIGLIVYLIVRSDHPVRPAGYAPYPGYPAPQYPSSPYPPPYPPQAPPPQVAPPPAGGPAAAATCKVCGSPLAPGATFCGKCGARV